MKRGIILAALVWALVPVAAWSKPVLVTGRVVDKGGKPVAGAEVAGFWNRDDQGKMKAY